MVIIMANKANSLAHTKWMCKYHIIFTPKYSLGVLSAALSEIVGIEHLIFGISMVLVLISIRNGIQN